MGLQPHDWPAGLRETLICYVLWNVLGQMVPLALLQLALLLRTAWSRPSLLPVLLQARQTLWVAPILKVRQNG